MPSIAAMPTGLDYLALLKGELVEHVRRARGALDPEHAGHGEEPGAAVCVDAMQQVQAVLQTLGLERLALAAQDIARVVHGLPAIPKGHQADVLAILSDGLDQLRDGIEQRATARPEAIWGLTGALNELRASLGLPLISEACVFAPGLEGELARWPATAASGAPSELAEVAVRERVVLHRGLFLWYSGREPARGLGKLRRVARALQETARTGQMQRLFLILEAFVVAIADDPIAPSGAVRRVLASVDRLLKQIGEDGEGPAAAAPPLDLVRNLLFYVATSGSRHRVVQVVRQGTDLRLVVANGRDGYDQAVRLLLPEVRRVRALVARTKEGVTNAPDLAALAAAVQRLSDGLAFAELGDQRSLLGRHVDGLHRASGETGALYYPLAELGEVLGAIEGALGAGADDGFSFQAGAASPAMEGVDSAARGPAIEIEEDQVVATDQDSASLLIEDAGSGARSLPGDAPGRAMPIDDEIREIFADEAAEKVESLRHHYVAWSAQHDDVAALDAVLDALVALKSTGRLVGADTLSEICWVLEAALRRCRDGALEPGEDTLAVLDDGIEMVDALVAAHVAGAVVEGDPRLVEQRLYGLLEPEPGAAGRPASTPGHEQDSPPAGAAAASGDAGRDLRVVDTEATGGDLDLVELFAEEAGDLAEALEDGLRGLEEAPARSALLMEMRRALRALAVAARHAELHQVIALCEAFDQFLGRTAGAGSAISPGALALTREATNAVAGVVGALRNDRLPQLPANLIDRLRDAGGRTTSLREPVAMAGNGLAALGEWVGGGQGTAAVVTPAALDLTVAQRLFEEASGAGICHLQLEEEVAHLRERVGRLEGILALLRLQPAGGDGAALPPRAAATLADLGNCADQLHDAILKISAQLRAQGHHLTGLQQGLVTACAGLAVPAFTDLLLVGVGDKVLALPAAMIEGVRRVAPELVPGDGELLELQGRPFAYRRLARLLELGEDEPPSAAKPQSTALVRCGGRDVALGIDRVLGHRTMLVAAPATGIGNPAWLLGLASLGGGRDAAVVDLHVLLAG